MYEGNSGASQMKTDKELLRLAAIAAGILTTEWADNKEYLNGVLERWNPLKDDADAFRLAIEMGFIVNCWLDAKKTWVGTESGISGVIELHGSDPFAATRRAIVRAAAAIVKL